jgi:hypothetical protein
MKNQRIKITPPMLAMLFLTAVFVCLTTLRVSAQTLEAGDIIYSRLPVAPSTSGTVWAIRQNGTNDRQIAVGSQPRLSPNGRYLLFRRSQVATEPYRFGQLWIRDLTTAAETLLITYSDYLVGYDFTSDSSKVVFDDPQFSEMRKMNLDGTGQIALGGSSFADDFPVARTSDNLIAHHRYDSFATAGIYTGGFTSGVQQLVPNTFNNIYPSWSPDGQFVACGSGSPLGPYPYLINNLFKLKPDGSGKVQLTNLATNNNFGSGFVWTAGGAKIIVPANINGLAGLYSINADGSGAPVLIPITAGANPDFVGAVAAAQAGGGGSYQLLQAVVAGGGGTSANGNYSLVSTIGEAIAGTTSAGGNYNLPSGFWTNSASARAPFDFDGDRKTDISIFRPGPGEWWYLKSSTGGNAALQFGTSTDKLVPGDFTGDGRTDIAFFRPSTGFWFILRSEDFSFFSFPFGAGGDMPAPADYDGDGRIDPAVFRPSTATWFISRTSDGGTTIAAFGAAGDKPVPADYDGDGKADIAIWRPAAGEWWYSRSSNGIAAALQFGTSTDKPVPGDYTGDGKADIAFFRPASGFWFILRSEDFSFFSFPFGAAGDVPVPGDYDADGKFDAAVFRPSNSTWFLNQTTAGVGIVSFGIAGDQPVPNTFIP